MDSGADTNQAASSGEDGERRPKKTRVSSTVKYSLPSRLNDLERHYDILKAYASKYSSTSEPVKATDLGALPGISVDKVTRNNKFYVEAGFLANDGRGAYRPVPQLLDFIKNRKHEMKDKAKENLRSMIGDKWFVNSVRVVLDMMNPAELGALISGLAYDSDAEPGVEDESLKVLIDLMADAGIVRLTSDDKYEWVDKEGVCKPLESSEGKKTEVVEDKAAVSPKTKSDSCSIYETKEISIVPKISIQLVLNIDKDVPPVRVKEFIRAAIEASADGH